MTWLALEQTFLWFLLYSFVGWLWETVLNIVMKKRFVDRGILNGPICPIYGFGALLAIYALPGEHSVVAIFLSSGVLCCTLEYFTSWAIEKLFHMRLWDYSGKPFNINGRVYLNGFLFFAAGCTVVKLWVQPHIMDLLDAIDPRTITVLAVALLVVLLADAAVTLAGLTSLNSRLGHAEQDIKALKARGIAHIDVGITAADKRIESAETRITTVGGGG
uniref:putative ABC transporter permease n=1 Tax=Bifidobacterium sp. TaxID=41200 RepID=UPI003869012E